MPTSQKKRGLSDTRLKIIATILLAPSLLSSLIFPSGTNIAAAANADMGNLTVAVLCEALSWAAIPLYAWLLVEGYEHSHNRWLYGLRLLALALICEVPYDMVTSGSMWDWNSQNPVFALVITLAALSLIDTFATPQNQFRWLIIVGLACAGIVWMLLFHIGVRQRIMQGGILLLILALIFHLMKKHENTMMMSAAIIGACFFIVPAMGVAVLHYRNEELGYDRQQQPWIQWVFYAIYPLMLIVFALA